MFSKSSGLLQYASIGWNPSILDFVTIFVRSKGVFESMYLIDLLLYIIGMWRQANAASVGEIGLAIISEAINYN